MPIAPPSRRARLVGSGAALAVTALALSACASSSAATGEAEPVTGGTLNVALGDVVSCLDPWQTDRPAEHNIYRQVTETLTSIDPDTGELRPWLAESWTPNDDATRFEFTLREGVHFSDGTELTPDVVKANFDEAAVLPEAKRGPSYLTGYVETEVIDDQTFAVVFDAPNASFLNRTASNFLSFLAPATLEQTAAERCSTGVIGTGAFVIESYAENQDVVLTARDDYDSSPTWASHDGRALLDEIIFSLVPESSSRLGLLTSGQVDLVQSLEAQDFESAEAAGATIDSRITPGFPLRLHFNTQKSVFNDENVLRAVSLYIDRDEINDVVFAGNAEPSKGLLTPNVPGYVDLADKLQFDTAEGDKLLTEAGWAKNADGIWAKDGQTLVLDITRASPYTSSGPLLDLLVQQLHAAGIDASYAEFTGDFTELTKTFGYEVLFSNTTDIDGDTLRGQLSPLAGNRGNLPESDPLTAPLAEQNEIGDVTARNELLADLQADVLDRGFQVPIIPVTQFYGIASGVSGVAYDAESRLFLYDATAPAE
ncbi:peptide/nickel transport system substrate-binding protein [Pseudoclavibacter sp. JAI123]|uniref:ABC transporter substrate-binding protein n=1 Tax=Pseudoclavibacter sp. JAI123 TaxID=2723065 RepID=UPI0015CE0162|nr:ABC transporter substrate-binding protein [Pseudoclavibacter sp. JAI123]NYF12640.1 peptide/nickel transport system substrate-binding protein [Pseudoclavibacter sp. JAI123]